MYRSRFCITILLIGITIPQVCFAAAPTPKRADPIDDNSSNEEELFPSSYVLPKQIFNDGKPFYAEKDPISGQFDFSSKKPAGIEPEVNEVIDPKEKIVLSSAAPNIHDFLNLPVKYSSSKFVYPLVSSSYANLKYQGNNKNFISNHKIHTAASATLAPKHNPVQKTTLAPKPKSPVHKTTLAPKYNDVQKSNSTRLQQETVPPRTSTTTTTTVAPTTTTTTTTTTRKPTTVPNLFDRTTPKRKYVPTKKYIPVSSTTPPSTIPTTERVYKYTKPETRPTRKFSPTTSTTTPTTPRPTEMEISLTTEKTPFRPMPSTESHMPISDPADVYNAIEHKNSEKQESQDTMTLSDIFNSLTEDEAESYAPPQEQQGLDNQGNLMQPISPSEPAPFSMQQKGKQPPPPSTGAAEHFNSNEYVQYQVQQPNMMQYHPMSNVNNVVISPGQNSASFVLGSQQNVAANMFVSADEKDATSFHKEPPIQYGTVISEDIASIQRPHQMPSNVNVQNIPIGSDQQTQELLVSSNIRFPYEEQGSEQGGNGPVPDTVTGHVNGHAQPVNLHKMPAQPVVFPPATADDQTHPETHFMQQEPPKKVIFKPESSVETEIQKQEILTLNQHQLQHKVSFPQLAEELTPPMEVMEPPRPNLDNRQGPPRPYNGPPPPPGFHYNEFPRKNPSNQPPPPPGIHRTNSERPLPNILPQFRPNAKISHGHPAYNKESGNVRLGQYPPTGPYQNRPGGPPPQFAQRRTPGMNRYPMKVMPGMQGMPQLPPQEATRRVYRVSPYQNQFVDRMYLRRPPPQGYQQGPPPPGYQQGPPPQQGYQQGPPPQGYQQQGPPPQHGYQHGPPPPQAQAYHQGPPPNFDEGYNNGPAQGFKNGPPPPAVEQPMQHSAENFPMERHSPHFRHPDGYSQEQPEFGLNSERLPAFEEEDMVINDPPKPVVEKDDDDSKLEPVVTLQMLKTKKATSTESDVDASPEEDYAGKGHSSYEQTGPSQGLYVVYPHKPTADMDINVSAETKDQAPAVAHFDSTGGADYQNTPFSVVRDQQQEPILMAKPKPQHQLKPQPQNKDKFPYPLERPDPSYSDYMKLQEIDRYDRMGGGAPVAARIISGGRPIHSSEQQNEEDTPIAIAYTPTEPSVYTNGYQSEGNRFANINTQTEYTGNEEPDTRGQNYEKDFMAPFYPSVSLSSVPGSPSGWNVYQATESSLYEKNKIDRSDTQDRQRPDEEVENSNTSAPTIDSSTTTTTKKSDTDVFQPELQGGFKPIYPPGYNYEDEDESVSLPRMEINVATTSKAPITLHSVLASASTPADIGSTSTVVTTTEKPTQRKKSQIETSLEALLFGDDEDFDEEDEGDSPGKARNASR